MTKKAPAETAVTPKRGRGRPRKNPIVQATSPAEPSARKRGRPRKHPVPVQLAASEAPRKRGRPRKTEAADKPEPATPTPKPGRPRKDPEPAVPPPKPAEPSEPNDKKKRSTDRPKMQSSSSEFDINRVRLIELKGTFDKEVDAVRCNLDSIVRAAQWEISSKITALDSAVARATYETRSKPQSDEAQRLAKVVEKVSARLADFRSSKSRSLAEMAKLSSRLDKALRKIRG